jgi:hypothetical protein
MSIKSNPKLKIELIPKTCHYSNVRTCLTTTQWDKIRKLSYEKANHVCEICGDTGKNQGFNHNVECHEIWEYDEYNMVQRLVGLISLCPRCHMVKHIGRSIAIGNEEVCYRQLAKVNKWDQNQIKTHITESFNKHRMLSKFKWELDISILANEPYNIDLSSFKERIFENSIPKKKKNKKKTTDDKSKKKKKLHPKAKINNVLKSVKNKKSKRPPKT